MLSRPHSTSPSGVPAVRIALEIRTPESPPVTTFTFAPVAAVNASKIPSCGVNASYASSVTSFGVASIELFDVEDEHAVMATTNDVAISIRQLRYC